MRLFQGLRSKFFAGTGGQSFAWNPLSGFAGRSKHQLLGEYRNLVYSCVSAISEDVAKYEPLFYHETPLDNPNEELPEHPFRLLLNNPNPTMSQFELMEATQSLIELTGECFWYLSLKKFSREPVAIDIMRPDRVNLAIDDRTGEVTGYVFNRPDGAQIPLEYDEVIHFKMYNPQNKYRGLGTVEAGLLYIDTENETANFQRNFMRNQASPSGVLTFKGNIAKDAFERVKKVWKDQQQGTDNAGKTLFIRETDVDFTKIGLSIAELDMTALKKITQDEVRGMFRMPKIMLGMTDESGLGRDVAETAEYIYQKRTIDPKLVRIDDAIRLYCRVAYKDPLLCVEHVSMVPQDKTKLIAEIKELTGLVYTQNESRDMLGLDPIQGGDELYISFNMTPIGQPLEPTPVLEPKSYGKITLIKPKAIEPPKVEKQSQETYIDQLNRIHARHANMIAANMRNIYRDQQRKVTDRFRNTQKKADDDYSIAREVGPYPDEDIAKILKKNLPEYFVSMEKAGQTSLIYLDEPGTEYLLDKSIRDAVEQAQERLLKSFNEQTADKIAKQLEAGLQAGETTEQITARIESVYSDVTGNRTKSLADSETNRLMTQANSLAYEQVGVTEVEWVTDGNPCAICESMEGTIIDIGSTFIGLGDTLPTTDRQNDYAPIQGGDMHTNCMCKLVPVMSTEKIYKKLVPIEKQVEVDNPELVKELEETKEYVEQLELIAGINGQTETT